MKPVMQTKFGVPWGNCLQACIASIFEISIEDAPDFGDICEDDDNKPRRSWWRILQNWCAERNMAVVQVTAGSAWIPENAYLIAGGKSPRGEFNHAVVWYGGKIVHDPHPDQTGLAERPTDYDLFVVLDPAKTKEA